MRSSKKRRKSNRINKKEIQSEETEDTPVVKAIVNVEIKDFSETEEQPSTTTDH